MDLSQIITNALATILTALIAYLVHYGVRFIKDLLLKYKVAEYVKSAEQIYNQSGLGKEKYEFVASKIVAFAADKLHFKLDEDQVQTLIESTVNTFFAKVKEEIAKPVETTTTTVPVQTTTSTTKATEVTTTITPTTIQPTTTQVPEATTSTTIASEQK